MPHGSRYLHEVPGAVQEKMKRQQRTLDFLDWIGLVNCCSITEKVLRICIEYDRSVKESKRSLLVGVWCGGSLRWEVTTRVKVAEEREGLIRYIIEDYCKT